VAGVVPASLGSGRGRKPLVRALRAGLGASVRTYAHVRVCVRVRRAYAYARVRRNSLGGCYGAGLRNFCGSVTLNGQGVSHVVTGTYASRSGWHTRCTLSGRNRKVKTLCGRSRNRLRAPRVRTHGTGPSGPASDRLSFGSRAGYQLDTRT
jgi:hypothetical protein